MAAKKRPKTKKCFIVAPIGDSGSDIRRRSDQLLKHVLKPALDDTGYEPIRADSISDPGNITSQILTHLVNDDLVIADLTGHNPNVFYELGIRHALGRPIIHIIEQGERIPFDIAAFRTIVINHRDLDSAEAARVGLIEAIRVLESDGFVFQGIVDIAQTLQATLAPQDVPISVYLTDQEPEKAEKVSQAVALFKEALNLVITKDLPPETNLWWKRWWTKTSEAVSQPEVAERLRKVERALELQSLHKPQADVDKLQAEAASKLIESLSDVENAVVMIGSVLLIKSSATGSPGVVIRSLTQQELTALERDPSLLRSPDRILEALSEAQLAVSGIEGTATKLIEHDSE